MDTTMFNTAKIKRYGLIGVLFFVVCYSFWVHSIHYPSTDDAYVQANIVQVAPQVSGPVLKLYVENNQFVKKNSPLLDIDPATFQVIVDKEKARLDLTKQDVAALSDAVKTSEALVSERQSELLLAQKNYQRIESLVHKGLATLAEGDKVTNATAVANAALTAASNQLLQSKAQLGEGQCNAQCRLAEADLSEANLNLSHTHIVSPVDGYIVNLSARPGALLQKGNAVFSIIDANQWWVDANFKETSMQRIQVGQHATIIVDTYPNHSFKGVVESISRGSGSAFSIFPAENATGNWVKVTQRFTVRIAIVNPDPHFPLRVGASASVKVDTSILNKYS